MTAEYIYFGSKRVARIDLPANMVHYYLSDALNSTSMVVSASGTIENESEYYPWGGELQFSANDSNHYKFSGKERDSETTLDYYGARYYGSALGRFLTPDFGGPMLAPDPVPWADLDNPQSLNLYSYVRNNPTSLNDPDGHDCVVQSRTGTNTENVSTSSGNCDNVKVGDGQTKTYVPGTVTGIQAGQDGKSIDIGYTPYEGGGSGVFNANAAPIPENTNLAYNWGNNAQGYRTLSQASTTVNMIAVATAVVSGGNLIMMAASVGGTATLGDLAIQPTAGEQAYAEQLLAKGGKEGVQKAIRTLSKRLAEHEAKLRGGLKYPGTVEREVGNFIRTIKALTDVLK